MMGLMMKFRFRGGGEKMTKFIKLTGLSINLKETDRDHPGLGCTKKERDDYYQYLK